MYRPAALEVVLREILVEVSVSVILAPATTAPVGSVTAPAIVPVDVDCAHMGRALPTQITTRRNRANLVLRAFIAFLLGWNSIRLQRQTIRIDKLFRFASAVIRRAPKSSHHS